MVDPHLNLAPYAGPTVTLRIYERHTNQYKSWVKLDDVEWSRQNATITNTLVEAFGANVTAPNDTGVTTRVDLPGLADAHDPRGRAGDDDAPCART